MSNEMMQQPGLGDRGVQVGGEDLATRSRGRSPRPWLGAVVGIVAVAALAAGCSSGSSSSTTTTGSSTSSSRSTATTLSTTAVRILQAALAKVGCYSGSIDGIDGSFTTAAVRSFQSATGLTVDGIYGSSTRSKLLATDNAGTKVCTAPKSTTTTSGSSSSTTTTASGGAPSAAIAAITSYETAHGPGAGTWQISSAELSTANSSYVFFRIGPAPGHQNTVQGGYGFALSQGGTWTVVGFGSSQVGCPPGNSQNQIIPSAVLAEFGVSCPPAT